MRIIEILTDNPAKTGFFICAFAFALAFVVVANRSGLKWSGLIVDAKGDKVSRGGLIAWVVFWFMLYQWTVKESTAYMLEAFGLTLLFLFGMRGATVAKDFLKNGKEKEPES